MQSFEFATAQQILFGRGKVAQLPAIAARHALRRVLVVTYNPVASLQPVIDLLIQAGIEVVHLGVDSEPSIPVIQKSVAMAIDARCDGVVAIGGGAVMDTGKAIAALMRNTSDLFEYLEVIGKGHPMEHASAPCIAIPTTSGTGAEVSRNAVLFSPEHAVKVSLRSASMLPVAAIVDPDLTRNLPPTTTAWSGMDALTQVIEPYTSARANPFTDALCLQAIPEGARSLPRAFHDGADMEARTGMSLVSLFGGLALANAGLGVVHGFAGVIGGMFPAPHGAICAAILPHGMAANIAHLKAVGDQASEALLQRYRTVARSLTGNPAAEPADGVEFVQKLSRELAIPPLAKFGMSAGDAEEVVSKSARASSMKANPVVLSLDELKEVYQRSL